MQNLDITKGYPQLMKWHPEKTSAVAEIVTNKITIGDAFFHNGRLNDIPYIQEGVVSEIIEERKAKGTHSKNMKFYRVLIQGNLKIK